MRHAVVWGRAVASKAASTVQEDVAELVAAHPKLLSGLGGIAIPEDGRSDDAVREVEKALVTLKLKGIALEPGFAMSPTRGADDPALLPYVRALPGARRHPRLTISVRAGSDIRFSNPEAVDRIAGLFPQAANRRRPFLLAVVAQACGVAYRRPNVYLLPDFYGLACPGHLQWVEAANSLLPAQIIFASAYPLAAVGPMVQATRHCRSGRMRSSVSLYRNAAALLKLE